MLHRYILLFLILLIRSLSKGDDENDRRLATTTANGSNNTRTYCYSGSSMNQEDIIDCVSQDREYKGEWYCAKMVVCEKFKTPSRDCIVTKGCAKKTECQDQITGSTFKGIYVS